MAYLMAGSHPADCCYRSGIMPPTIFAPLQAVPAMVVKSGKRVLREAPHRAILRLAGALARQAAREDHAREQAEKIPHESDRDLRTLLNRPPE
ncbi:MULTISPECIES: hypothetical protein [unclassified Mesorhizobium]|uniref:hypothetical protein n=1 Tax=unclassified Mesorhizobium TaxID=325217 RepID=UPI0015E2FD4F|nr:MULTISPECIES: hypothetical protein [unclassified Mesorhizobium]